MLFCSNIGALFQESLLNLLISCVKSYLNHSTVQVVIIKRNSHWNISQKSAYATNSCNINKYDAFKLCWKIEFLH